MAKKLTDKKQTHITIDKNMRDYSNEPAFVKAAERAAADKAVLTHQEPIIMELTASHLRSTMEKLIRTRRQCPSRSTP